MGNLHNGSAQLTGEAPGLQIRCRALEPSWVGSIPMHFRHLILLTPHLFLGKTNNIIILDDFLVVLHRVIFYRISDVISGVHPG